MGVADTDARRQRSVERKRRGATSPDPLRALRVTTRVGHSDEAGPGIGREAAGGRLGVRAMGSLPAAPSVRYSALWLFCWRLLGRHGPWDPKKPAVAARAERWRSLAERAALEMRCTFGYRGFESRPLRQPNVHSERCWSLAEQARLESVCTRKGTVGSNPTRSAIPRQRVSCNQTPPTG